MKKFLWVVLVALLPVFPAQAGFSNTQWSSGSTINWDSGNILPSAQWVPASTSNVGGGASWNTSSGALGGYGTGKVPVAGGAAVIDVNAKVVPNMPSVGGAIVNFLKKTVLPLQVGLAAYELAKDLGYFVSKDAAGNLVVEKERTQITCSADFGSPPAAYTGGNFSTTQVCIPTAPGSNMFAYGWSIANPDYGMTGVSFPCGNAGCPTGGGWIMLGTTAAVVSVSRIPASPDELAAKIASESGWPALPKAVSDAIQSGETVTPDAVKVNGPSSVPGPSKTTTNPDGSSQVQNTTYNITYNNNTINTTTTTTTVYKDSTGTVTGQKTDAATGDNSKSECDLHPDTVGCQHLGAPPSAETIPTKEVPVSITAVVFAAPAGCPAPYTGQIKVLTFVKQWSITFDPMCDLMNTLRPLFLATGAAAAAFLFMESLKS